MKVDYSNDNCYSLKNGFKNLFFSLNFKLLHGFKRFRNKYIFVVLLVFVISLFTFFTTLTWLDGLNSDLKVVLNDRGSTGSGDILCPEPVGLYDNGNSAMDWFNYNNLPISGSLLSNFISIPRFRISLARNTKAASTTMTAILAFLHQSRPTETAKDFFRGNISSRPHMEKWLQSQPVMTPSQLFNKTWLKIFIVRDPVQRFLSAWRFACEGTGFARKHDKYCCSRNVTCYAGELHDRLHYLSHTWEPFGTGWPGAEHWYSHRFVERHFVPQTWYLGLGALPKSVVQKWITIIPKNNQFLENIIRVLQKHKYVPAEAVKRLEEGKDKFRRRWSEGKVSNQHYGQVEDKVLHDTKIRDCIQKIYSTDYKIFSEFW